MQMLPAALRTSRARRISVPGLLTLVALTSCQELDQATAPETPITEHQPEFSLQSQEGSPNHDRYIVGFVRGTRDVEGLAHGLARAHGGTVHFTYTEVLQGFALSVPAAALEGIRRNPHVQFVEPDQVVAAAYTQSNATWGLDRIDQRALPLDRYYSYTTTGAGVTAYVFDTGIRLDHVEFGGRARAGYDAIRDGKTGDCNGHGTHVAGILGGKTYGVAKGVQLVSVRVLGCDGYGMYSGMIAGMDWALKTKTGPAVANFSLSGNASSTLNSAIAKLIAGGVPTAVAAGNENKDACKSSPASAPDAVTTGASTKTDARWAYSNWGKCLDLFAPGAGITAASWSSSTGTRAMSGTSMATPHVAGVLALLKAQRPDLTALQLRDWLVSLATRNQVTNAQSTNAHLLNSVGDVAPPVTTEPPPPSGLPAAPTSLTGTRSGTTATLTWRDNSGNESGFRIQRRRGTGSWLYLATVGANTTRFATSIPTTGDSYSYRVYAYNSEGSSGYSNSVTFAP